MSPLSLQAERYEHPRKATPARDPHVAPIASLPSRPTLQRAPTPAAEAVPCAASLTDPRRGDQEGWEHVLHCQLLSKNPQSSFTSCTSEPRAEPVPEGIHWR